MHYASNERNERIISVFIIIIICIIKLKIKKAMQQGSSGAKIVLTFVGFPVKRFLSIDI